MTPEAAQLLAEHQARVDGLFAATPDGFENWVDTTAGQAICKRWGQEVISAAIAAAAERTQADEQDVYRIYLLDAEHIDGKFGRRKLAVTPDDAALMIDLATDPACGYYEIRVALRFAEHALDAHPNHPAITDGLVRLQHYLDTNPLHVSGFFIAKVAPWLSRLLAEQTPTGLLDLSFIDQRCNWGKAAALAISHWAESQPTAGDFALHLASPRGTRAPKKWWATTEQLMQEPWRRELVAELSGYFATTELTPRDDDVDGLDAPEAQLVVVVNQIIARGVMWAETFAVDDGAPQRIGEVIERAAVPFRGWDGATPRCSKVALAGIKALADSQLPSCTTELERLFGVLALASLIRPVGKALGLDEAAIKRQIRAR